MGIDGIANFIGVEKKLTSSNIGVATNTLEIKKIMKIFGVLVAFPISVQFLIISIFNDSGYLGHYSFK